MLGHQGLCLSSAVHSRSQFYNFTFCQYSGILSLRFFGNTCKRVDTYFVLSVILK